METMVGEIEGGFGWDLESSCRKVAAGHWVSLVVVSTKPQSDESGRISGLSVLVTHA